MNSGLRILVSLLALTIVLYVVGCGGGSSITQPPPATCQSTATIKCTRSGAVQGVGIRTLYAFRGIPYAAPPVGNLRWKAPQPPGSWKGTRDASNFGKVCPQFDFSGRLVGDEDCLTLNVYISQNAPSQNLPVMVFVHGGSNSAGDAQILPAIVAQGVVMVTVQYRLGMLGFFANPLLTTEGGGSSAHYGLADQVAALQWVHNNIAAFGGDPQHVMLFGQSAGGWDVQTLLAIPSAQGLFSVAGDESGPVPAGRLPDLSTLEAADQSFVSAAGCSGAADVLACMRALSANTIVNLQTGYRFYSAIGSAFLPTDPFVALQQNGSPVPLLIGSNREEFALFESPNSGMDNNGYIAAVHQRFDPLGAGVANQVLSLYPSSAFISPAYALIAVDTDFNFTCETRNIARAASGTNRQPVWRYLYTHTIENSTALHSLGAFHAQELFFVFGDFSGINYTPTGSETTLSADMMGYWVRFAATGNPNGGGAINWPRYDATNDAMLQIDDNQVGLNGYKNIQCDYFSTLPQP